MGVTEQHTSFEFPIVGHGPKLASRDLSADYAHCFEVMRGASKNYSFASMVLPASKSHHVAALYAVMRVGDDRVDVSSNGFASPLAAIEDWRDSYWRAFEMGDSPHPVLRAYLHTSHELHIPPELLHTYFRAMIEDLTIKRFTDFAALLHYMDGSAIPVGRVMAHILGTHTPHVSDVYEGADALSIAMQLSNFWRDVGEDWGIGRVYLPQEDMAHFGVTEDDLANQRVTPAFIDLLEFEFERTEQYYVKAREAVHDLASGRWAVMAALEIYRAIILNIRRNHYDVFTRRNGANRNEKIRLAMKAWWQTRF